LNVVCEDRPAGCHNHRLAREHQIRRFLGERGSDQPDDLALPGRNSGAFRTRAAVPQEFLSGGGIELP
jgi:hypothetical protein